MLILREPIYSNAMVQAFTMSRKILFKMGIRDVSGSVIAITQKMANV